MGRQAKSKSGRWLLNHAARETNLVTVMGRSDGRVPSGATITPILGLIKGPNRLTRLDAAQISFARSFSRQSVIPRPAQLPLWYTLGL